MKFKKLDLRDGDKEKVSKKRIKLII